MSTDSGHLYDLAVQHLKRSFEDRDFLRVLAWQFALLKNPRLIVPGAM
ncbi:MAG: hypothetical protein ACUVXJ_07315 [Phycisphaerae bacterium]